MKGCRRWRNRLPEAVYGELDAKTREGLMRHLHRCKGCMALYESMAAAVRKMEARPAPDREAEFWDGYWDRLQARMARETVIAKTPQVESERGRVERPRGLQGLVTIRSWAYAAAGALLFIALGIFLGRTVFRPSAGPATLVRTAPPEAARSGRTALRMEPAAASLSELTSRYLRRSRVVLLAFVNEDARDKDPLRLNLALQKRTSQELLAEAVVLKKGIGSSDRRLERLVSELEWVLIQIAHLRPDSDVSDIEVIKAGIESRDIIFKINLDEVRRSPGKSGGGRAPSAWNGPGDSDLAKAAPVA